MAKESDIEIKKNSFLALIAGKSDAGQEWGQTVWSRWKDYYIAESGAEQEEADRTAEMFRQYDSIRGQRPEAVKVGEKIVIKGID